MKNLGKFLAVASFGFAVACNNAPTETVETVETQEVEEVQPEAVTYALVTEGDEVKWEGFKTYSDDSHNGTIQVTEGSFSVEGEALVGGSFIIDMNSINSVDLAENAEYKGKLEGHLKAEDFFFTESFPTATFTITGVEAAADAEKGTTHIVSGNLMLRGTEKNISFPAKVDVTGDMVSLSAPQFVIDRTEWNVMYGSKNLESLAKDKLIDNNIRLEVSVSAKRA